jgi:hypothetical protein
VEPFIASALEHANGDYTAEQVKVYASSGEWLILVAVEDDVIHGAAAIQFFNRPNDRVAFIIAVGGRLVSSEETVAQLKVHCAAHGATIIEGAARPAIARLWARYKFEEKYRIVGVRL